ncbi:MAG: long-chain fatty acid--CoA ligase [Fimbriimonadaceae bacterium]|nr:long-chain fatty acid--CoA ligase [Fimbriimonadaceae bacterium]
MKSLPALVRQAVADHADRPAVLLKDGGNLVEVSYRAFGERLDQLACGLLDLGVTAGERVVLLSENCPEWVEADVASLAVGATTVPLYPSLPAEQIAPLVQRVRARLVIVEDQHQYAKIESIREQLPSVERVVVFRPEKLTAAADSYVTWADLAARGAAARDELQPRLAAREAALRESDIATIIFTSGTTGVPKGAMLTHGNLLFNVQTCLQRLHLEAGERFVTFLPLSHVFQRMVTFLGISVGAANLYNESLRALGPNLVKVRPTVLISVPRFLELIRERVSDGIQNKTGLAGVIARWALQVADQVSRAYVEGRPLSGWLKLQQRLAEQRVFSAVREQIGLDRLRFTVAGGAALPPELGRWFYGLGIRICQGYGLTETAPVVTINDPREQLRFDCIGRPVAGIEVKIADDGEILTRGPHVMAGYFEMPAETAEAIDADGWFHTGDIGRWVADGQIQITDRKKNIMVLANGKNVAPVPIESRLLESPLINQLMLIGDHQNVVTALIVPSFEALQREVEAKGESVADRAALCASKTAEKLVRAEISRLSGDLAPFEMVRKFRLLPRELDLEHNEMTPTLKIRRREVLANWASLVAEMAE